MPKKEWRLLGLVTRATMLQNHRYYKGSLGYKAISKYIPPPPPVQYDSSFYTL